MVGVLNLVVDYALMEITDSIMWQGRVFFRFFLGKATRLVKLFTVSIVKNISS